MINYAKDLNECIKKFNDSRDTATWNMLINLVAKTYDQVKQETEEASKKGVAINSQMTALPSLLTCDLLFVFMAYVHQNGLAKANVPPSSPSQN